MRNLTVSRAVLLLCAVTFAAWSQASRAETTLERIKRTGSMKAAATFTYAPFDYVEAGKRAGLNVDLGEELGKRMGVTVTFEAIDLKGIIGALVSKRVDVLITALTWTPERAERVLFSEPYFDGGIGAAFLIGSVPISKPEDIVGKRVGLQLGSAGDKWTRDKFGEVLGTSVKSYDTLLLALKDLQGGRTDVVVSALPAVRYAIRSMPNIGVTSVWDSRPIGINARKEDAGLMEEINRHMKAMKQDGTLDKLVAKWFGPQ